MIHRTLVCGIALLATVPGLLQGQAAFDLGAHAAPVATVETDDQVLRSSGRLRAWAKSLTVPADTTPRIRRNAAMGRGAALGAGIGALLAFLLTNNSDAGENGDEILVFVGGGAVIGALLGSNAAAQREAANP